MDYKQFYFWLQGYLHGKLENKHIDIVPIVEKMNSVKEGSEFDVEMWKHLSKSVSKNPIIPVIPKRSDDDDLGLPPRIVM
jgi:hypothetical protein